ncbi:MAG: hypothetical protein ACRDHP_01420, partial [Ktedonobacterales bacterium]
MADEQRTVPSGDESGESGQSLADASDLNRVTPTAPRAARPRRRLMLASAGAALIVAFVLALLLTTLASSHFSNNKGAALGTSGLATASSTSLAPAPASPAAPLAAMPTSTSDSGVVGVGGPGTSPSPPLSTGQPMHVTGASLTLNPTNFDGVCTEGMPFTVTLTITVAPTTQGGDVNFHFIFDSGSDGNVYTVTFSPGEFTTTSAQTFIVPALGGDGSPHWVAAQLEAANTLTSSHVNFSLTCVRRVLAMSGSATPNSWVAPCSASQTFNIAFDVIVSLGPDATATWSYKSSNGFTSSDGSWHSLSGTTPLLGSFDGTIGAKSQTLHYNFPYD